MQQIRHLLFNLWKTHVLKELCFKGILSLIIYITSDFNVIKLNKLSSTITIISNLLMWDRYKESAYVFLGFKILEERDRARRLTRIMK
jgi:hypothetical protein